ncbi:MAG: DUF695 domain-containing protein [Flavobacteriales bacterium]|nr:DUF695 domain-containing protein [Flavobacteriales bacterium]
MDYQYVQLEEENLYKMSMERNGAEGFVVVNDSLNHFKYKNIFPWNLSIRLNFIETGDDLLPTEDEMYEINQYRFYLEGLFNNEEKPNVLFVGIVCIDDECDLIWRVNDPEKVDEILKIEVKIEPPKFEFGYRMTDDIEWIEVEDLIDL